jgi:hypothetical protein
VSPSSLRLTGEQIDSINPPPENDWFMDWDEYEDFVPSRVIEAERARYDELVEAARLVLDVVSDDAVSADALDALRAVLAAIDHQLGEDAP